VTTRILGDVVAASTHVLGPDHTDTLRSLHALALSHADSGEHAEATRILRDVVAARTRVLGPDHPDTQESAQELRTAARKI
jgi:Tetratricopeptide repeat